MMLKNVERYYPDEMPLGSGIQYFRSAEGKDFYDSFELFRKKYKFCAEPGTGIIHSVSEDISMLYPAGFDIVEADSIPDGFNIHGEFQFKSGAVIPRIYSQSEYISQAEQTKNALLTDVMGIIAPLQDAVDLEMATDSEQTQLLAWKKYRVLLNRVDTSTAPGIEWPEAPHNVA